MQNLKIETVSDGMTVRVTDTQSEEWMQESSVQAVLLFSILDKLEEIRCGLIDVESAIEQPKS